jgi:hypothetical protein
MCCAEKKQNRHGTKLHHDSTTIPTDCIRMFLLILDFRESNADEKDWPASKKYHQSDDKNEMAPYIYYI